MSGSRVPRGTSASPVGARPAGDREPAVVAVIATRLGPLHAAATGAGIIGLELRTTDEAFGASIRTRTGRPVLALAAAEEAGAAAAGAVASAGKHASTPASRAGAENETTPTAGARAHLAALEREVAEHFAGRRREFDVPVVLEGCSEWDRRVLEGVRTVAHGSTASYGEVARRIGRPGAARAVGGAVGRNPIGLLVPCHRVVAGDGTLGGYGGSWAGSRDELLGLKERLLEVEGTVPPPRSGANDRRRRDRRA